MKSKPEPIGDVLKGVFKRLESEKRPPQEDMELAWKACAGPDGFKHSRPMTLREGRLTVFVDSSAWMQELSMRKRRLLKGLKSAIGKDRITEIHFKIGEF